ncbi:MAG TPA: TRAP transporter small permease subunit [Thermohalobaculum sp.]|nr:TRAP transporter small permease subunit [Thermohalobaculum sp.]
MADASANEGPAAASPAPVVRMFGWSVLAAMAAYLINAVLTFWFGLPGAGGLFGWQSYGPPGPMMWLQVAIYVLLPLAACLQVLRTPHVALRDDAKRVSDANAFLIRAAFWVVLLVGLSDGVISFLRVEGFLPAIFGDEMAIELGKSDYRGRYVHVPFVILGIILATFTRTLGFTWLALMVVVAELLIVFSRFIFSYEQAFMSDLVRFWYAALFLFASGHTLLEDGHVRVDVFYSNFRRSTQGRVNAVGSILLGISLCWTILIVGMWTKSSIIISPILIFETTQTGFGMYVKYFMAGFIGVFAISMMIQFVSMLFDSVADSRNEPGGHEDHHAGHIG